MKTERMTFVVVGALLAGMLALAVQAPAQPAGKPYIPLISKGFQHQFWQAVKLGSEQAAKDNNVTITFEGPENESQVDKQIEMEFEDVARGAGKGRDDRSLTPRQSIE